MVNSKLTGKTRHRVAHTGWLFKKPVFILQVEQTWADGPGDSSGMPSYLPGTGWRDATVSDIEELAERNLDKLMQEHASEFTAEARTAAHKLMGTGRRASDKPSQSVNPRECNAEVLKHGRSMGMHDMTKDEAEEFCAAETKRTGFLHDWHYVGGRVHILWLVPKSTSTGNTND